MWKNVSLIQLSELDYLSYETHTRYVAVVFLNFENLQKNVTIERFIGYKLPRVQVALLYIIYTCR